MEIVILEGIDCTGKSTIAAAIIKNTCYKKAKVIHMSNENANTVKEFKRQIKQAKKEGVELLVYDRSFIGELVYGSLYRRSPSITIEQVARSIKKYKHTVILYVVEDWDKYFEKCMNRDNECPEERPLEQATFTNICADLIKLGVNVYFKPAPSTINKKEVNNEAL